MKVTFNIECTPQEARAFFGLPDVAPMQERMMETLEKQLQDNLRSLDPETMLKTWLPATIQGWSDMQKIFWDQMGGLGPMGTMSGAASTPPKTASSKKK
jgi:hypothetical protein